MVNAVLDRLYREQRVVHRNGRSKPVCPPGISVHKGEYLFDLVRTLRPAHSLECGFAYGLSTLWIAEALRQNGVGHHVVIDPKERTRFDGIGLRHVEEAGLAERITFYEEPAELCLPRLFADGLRLDFAFNDSDHVFDHVVAEFVLLARMLVKGGVLVLDDANLDGVGRVCDYVATNRPDFEEIGLASKGLVRRLMERSLPAPPAKTMRAFRKIADEDERDWGFFVPF
jgi:predicted O-methyltransferase YrrM